MVTIQMKISGAYMGQSFQKGDFIALTLDQLSGLDKQDYVVVSNPETKIEDVIAESEKSQKNVSDKMQRSRNTK